MNEYSIPFLLYSQMERIFWGLPCDRHEGNDKFFGQYLLFSVGGKLDLMINEQWTSSLTWQLNVDPSQYWAIPILPAV